MTPCFWIDVSGLRNCNLNLDFRVRLDVAAKRARKTHDPIFARRPSARPSLNFLELSLFFR